MAVINHNDVSVIVVHEGGELAGIISRFLQHEGYKVIEAPSPDEAIALGRVDVEIDLLLCNLAASKGLELGLKMRTVRSKVPIVLITDSDDAEKAAFAHGFISLRQPLLFAELISTLTMAIEKPSPTQTGQRNRDSR